ncbi:hypothetical protein Tco_0869414 [Tanacetum coccineum]
MEAHCIALELKYQNHALKSGQHGQILNEASNKAKMKKEIDAFKTINIELKHSVAKLLQENETLKKHYKDLKVFAIAALKNELRKLKGNSVDTKFAKTSVLGKPILQSLRNQSVVRQPNAFKSERPLMSKPRFASQVDVNNNLSKPVTQHYLPKRRASAFAKPDPMIASSSSRNSSKNMPRFSSNDMVNNYYLEEASKKTQERSRNSKSNKTSPRSDLRWKPTGRIFDTVGLRWIPTGKLLDSCMGKVDSTSINVLKKQSIDLSAGTSYNVKRENLRVCSSLDPKCQRMMFDQNGSSLAPQRQQIVMTSMIEMKILFGLCSKNYSNGENQVVSKSSVVTTADASNKCQQQQDLTSSTSTLATTVTADGNFDL